VPILPGITGSSIAAKKQEKAIAPTKFESDIKQISNVPISNSKFSQNPGMHFIKANNSKNAASINANCEIAKLSFNYADKFAKE